MLDKPINEYRVNVDDICYPFSFAVLVPGATKEESDNTMFDIILKWRGHVQEGHDDMNVTPLYVDGNLYESGDEPYVDKNFRGVFVYHFSFDECKKSCFDVEVQADSRFVADVKLIQLMTNWRDIVDFEFCRKTVLTPIKWGVNGDPFGSTLFNQVHICSSSSADVKDRDSLIEPAEYFFLSTPLLVASAALKLEGHQDFSLYADVVSASARKVGVEVDVDAVSDSDWFKANEVEVIPCIFNFSEAEAQGVNAVYLGSEVYNQNNVANITPVIGKPSPVSVDVDSYLNIPVKQITTGGTGIDNTTTVFIVSDSFDLDHEVSMWVAPDNVSEMLGVNTLLNLSANGKDTGAIVRVNKKEESK